MNERLEKRISIYKPEFLKSLRKAEKQGERGEVFDQEEITKEFWL